MQPIAYLTIEPLDPSNGYAIEQDTRIGNNPGGAAQLTEPFVGIAGAHDLYVMRHIPTFGYVLKSHDVGTLDHPAADAYLNIFVVMLQFLTIGLWLVKDNSVNTGRAYILVQDKDGPHSLHDAHTTQFYTADCELRSVHFTRAEFDEAVAFRNQLNALVPKRPQNQRSLTGLTKGNRLTRTLYFVQAARNTSDLLIKVAFYCICLESLLSTDTAGVSHRVSERAAIFLGTTGQEQRAIYLDVHRLYAARSAVVHGAAFKESKVDELLKVTIRCDDYLRRCLTRILGASDLLTLFTKQDGDAINAFFVEKLFPNGDDRPAS